MIFTAVWHLTGLLSLLSIVFIIRKLKVLLQGQGLKKSLLCIFCGFVSSLFGCVLVVIFFETTPDLNFYPATFYPGSFYSDAFYALRLAGIDILLYLSAFAVGLLLGFLLRKFWPPLALGLAACLGSAFLVFYPYLFYRAGQLWQYFTPQ